MEGALQPNGAALSARVEDAFPAKRETAAGEYGDSR